MLGPLPPLKSPGDAVNQTNMMIATIATATMTATSVRLSRRGSTLAIVRPC